MGFAPKETILTLADLTDAAPESVLTSLVDAACAMAESYTGRRFLQAERTQCSPAWPGHEHLLLKAYPVVEVSTVTLDGETLSGWHIDPETGILTLPHLHRPCAVAVVYTGGYDVGELPSPVMQAVAMLASALHKALANAGQVLSAERVGNWQGTYALRQGEGLDSISVAAAALLRPYCGRM